MTSDMEEEELDKLNEELLEALRHSANESDRGFVIFSAAQIDLSLRKILEAFLVKNKLVEDLFDDAFAPLSSLSGKTKMAFVEPA
jgi:hypothetical protein